MTTRPDGQLGRYVPSLLRDLAFRRFWTAQSISYLGDQVTIVALPLVAVLTLDASAAEMGVLAAAASLPNLLFSLHAGHLLDRSGQRRRIMIWTDVVRAAVLVTVPLAYLLDALTLPHLYAVAFLTGSLSVLFNLCANTLFAAMVNRDDYLAGAALTRGSYSFSWIAGPSVGGVLVQVLSAPITLVLDTLSYLGSALLMRSISPEEPPPDRDPRGGVREGLRFIRRTPTLLAKFAAGATDPSRPRRIAPPPTTIRPSTVRRK